MLAYLDWERPVGYICSMNELLVWQAGRCAMCGRRRSLKLDHCHIGGWPRGWLCNQCNTGEGYDRVLEHGKPAWVYYRRHPPALLYGPRSLSEGRRSDHAPPYTYEQRRAQALAASRSRTPGQMSEWGRLGAVAAFGNLTPERRSEIARLGSAAYLAKTTFEQRSEITRRSNAKLTPEQRSARAQLVNSRRDPAEHRRSSSRAGSATAARYTTEEWSAIVSAGMMRSGYTGERRRAAALKAVETRRRRRG